MLSGMCSPHKGQLTAAGLYKIFTRFPFHRRQANLLRCKVSENFAQKTNLFVFFAKMHPNLSNVSENFAQKTNLFDFFAKMHPNLSNVSENLA